MSIKGSASSETAAVTPDMSIIIHRESSDYADLTLSVYTQNASTSLITLDDKATVLVSRSKMATIISNLENLVK